MTLLGRFYGMVGLLWAANAYAAVVFDKTPIGVICVCCAIWFFILAEKQRIGPR